MNVELLRKIAAVIQGDPDQFYMGNWHSCDTKHCIGGWAQVLSNAPQNSNADEMAAILEIEFVREEELERGIEGDIHASDECEAGRLFYQENWPDEFVICGEDDCAQHPYTSESEAAAYRIEHFIATDGRE